MPAYAAENVHQLVLTFGKEKAREMVEPGSRLLVDIAAEVLADEQQQIGISYTGFCLTSLPHKKLGDDEIWERRGHNVTLLVEPSTMRRNGKDVKYGVPYGARARMILLYLQTQAVRTRSREVELGRSMRSWMERMDVAIGGETIRAIRDQAARISACSLKFYWEGEDANSWARGGIVSAGLRFNSSETVDLWDDRVTLDEIFWKHLSEHPVPLHEAALRQLAHRSLALDVYVWLAWRCHELKKATNISWLSLSDQFNTKSDKQIKRFKPIFTQALRAATAAYPGSRIDVEDCGITIYPARPPVPKLVV